MTTFHPTFGPAHAIERGAPSAPLVVLLHGRGSDAGDIISLAEHLPPQYAYAALRAPIGEGGGFAWFANRGIGRPIAESLSQTMTFAREWLDGIAGPDRPVVLAGFSGGGAFAGGLLLDDPARFAGAAILNATLPFDAGVPTTPGRLSGVPVFLSHGQFDTVIPPELQARTWEYLHDDSGAALAAGRAPAGHELTVDTVAALSAWIDTVLSEVTP